MRTKIMKIILDSGKEVKISELSFTDWRRFMSEYLSTNSHSDKAWDILSCVRGPDSPSERPDMSSEENDTAYNGRRARKYKTVEIIRDAMFFGVVKGGARHHKGTKVILPPHSKPDRFDKHVEIAAGVLDLKIKYEEEEV